MPEPTRPRSSARRIALPLTVLSLVCSIQIAFRAGRYVGQSWARQYQRAAAMESHNEKFNSSDKNASLWLGEDSQRRIPLFSEPAEFLRCGASETMQGYNEAFVHPAMIAHKNPSNVALIGYRHGVIQEILKHKDLSNLYVMGIEGPLSSLPRECCPTKIKSGMDPRLDLVNVTTMEWFSAQPTMYLDVVFLDDPVTMQDLMERPHASTFLKLLFAALKDDGILVARAGYAPRIEDPSQLLSARRNQAMFVEQFASLGAELIFDYQVPSYKMTRNGRPFNFLVVMKSAGEHRERWMSSEAFIQYRLKTRLDPAPSNDGSPSVEYFDGATMRSFQYPSKGIREVFCRRDPSPPACLEEHGIPPDATLVEVGDLYVAKSQVSDTAGKGVFVSVDVPSIDAILGVEGDLYSVDFPMNVIHLIEDQMHHPLLSECSASDVELYMYGYGYYESLGAGHEHIRVDSTILTFVNHGCRGTYNMGINTNVTEATADPKHPPSQVQLLQQLGRDGAYNPAVIRDTEFSSTSIRPLVAGEELLDNYLGYITHPQQWREDIEELRAMCEGRGSDSQS